MKIISANWREIRVQCGCGNVISVTLGMLSVRCKCGESVYMSELYDQKDMEHTQRGKADRYLEKVERKFD